MNVLFCHDGPLKKDKNGNFYGVAHNDDTFRRYYFKESNLSVLIRVTDIKADNINNKFSKITVKPIKIIEIPNLSSLKGQLCGRRKVMRTIKKQVSYADYIIIRLPSIIGLYTLKYAKAFNKPYLIELVACQWTSLWNHSFKGKLAAPLGYYLIKKAVKYARAVVYITDYYLQKRYPTYGQQFVVPNVKLSSLDQSVLDNRLLKIGDFSVGKTVSITSVGATNMRYKGHAYMIKAISILLKMGINVEYHIVGGGDDSRLQKIVKKLGLQNNVIFHGTIPHEKIFSILDKTDIYVQPSLAEAQGRSLIEAMSRGCPCVCTNVGGMPELIQKEFIAKKKNSKSLADKIRLTLNSDLKEIAKRNFEFAKKFESTYLESKRRQVFEEVFKI